MIDSNALYLRKSRADIELEAKGELETLARHEKLLLAHAKQMKLNVTKIYKEVVSGETIAARPVMQQLLEDVKNGMYSGVIVTEIERLARGDTIDQGMVANTFKYSNTKIITPTKTYDPNNEQDEEYFEFGLFMSRREYKTIKRRLQGGRIASVKEGKFIGSVPPYGYDKVKIPSEKGYTLEPNAEAEIVKLIYKLYTVDNLGMSAIASHLDNMYIKPRYGKYWSKSTISDILKNPVYCGLIRWSFKKEIKFYEGHSLQKKRVKSNDYTLIKGLHEALIDEETFNVATKLMSLNYHPPVKKNLSLQNPLSGIAYCGKCGSLLTRLGPNKKNRYDTLKCPNKNCNNISSPIFLIERVLLEELNKLLERHSLKLDLDDVDKSDNDEITLKQNMIKKLNDEYESTQKQINNTYDLLEQGIYSTEVFLKRSALLNNKLKEINTQIEDLKVKIEEEKKYSLAKDKLIPTFKSVIGGYDLLENAQDKNELLKMVIKRIDYTKNTPNRRGSLENANFELKITPFLSI